MSRGLPNDWSTRRRRVYKRDNYQCQNCGRRGGPRGSYELHAHHIVPKSKGGTHQLSNLKTICNECHKAIHGNRMAPSADRTTPKYGSRKWHRRIFWLTGWWTFGLGNLLYALHKRTDYSTSSSGAKNLGRNKGPPDWVSRQKATRGQDHPSEIRLKIQRELFSSDMQTQTAMELSQDLREVDSLGLTKELERNLLTAGVSPKLVIDFKKSLKTNHDSIQTSDSDSASETESESQKLGYKYIDSFRKEAAVVVGMAALPIVLDPSFAVIGIPFLLVALTFLYYWRKSHPLPKDKDMDGKESVSQEPDAE